MCNFRVTATIYRYVNSVSKMLANFQYMTKATIVRIRLYAVFRGGQFSFAFHLKV